MEKNFSTQAKSAKTEHHLGMYAITAAAAGVSVLALAQPSEASLVVTRKNIAISHSSNGTLLDLNHDGIPDFQLFFLGGSAPPPNANTYLWMDVLAGGGVIGTHGRASLFGTYLSALARGAKIGPSDAFYPRLGLIEIDFLSNGVQSLIGKWGGNPPNRFLGIKISIKGETHYGWIRLTVNTTGRLTATITGYAYETIPNKAVTAGVASDSVTDVESKAPDYPSLGMLALGVDGLALWRRDEM